MTNKVAFFQIIFEKKRKKYLFLDEISYNNLAELFENYQKLQKRYGNLKNVNVFEFDRKDNAYITFNSSKKKVLLYPDRKNLQ